MDENKIIPNSFDISYIEEAEQISPLITKARVRVFYKYKNRNGGYIDDDFARKLEEKILWTPVVGIFDNDTQDFTGHASDRNLARTYGFVPSPSNGSWEKRTDKDGITREYFAVDVYLYTGRYENARKIIGKPQSLEFDRESITGGWVEHEGGEVYYHYTNADFIGLSTLGTNIEPCFEGSAFYQLVDKVLKNLDSCTLDKVIEFAKCVDFSFNNSSDDINNKGGQEIMEFKFSSDAKINLIWKHCNADYENVGLTNVITDVSDSTITMFNLKEGTYSVVGYSIEGENVTLKEDAVQYALVENEVISNYKEQISEFETKLETLKTQQTATGEEDFEKKLEEANGKIVELETQKNTFALKAEEAEAALNALQVDFDALNEEKKEKLLEAKNQILNEYENKISAETMSSLKEKIGDYSLEDLEKEVLFAWKKELPADFSINDLNVPIVPSSFRQTDDVGIVDILNQYKNS